MPSEAVEKITQGRAWNELSGIEKAQVLTTGAVGIGKLVFLLVVVGSVAYCSLS